MTTSVKLGTRTSREQFCWDAVYKELELAGHDRVVLQNDKEWYTNCTMTTAQLEEWKRWFIAEVRKRFRLSKEAAIREFDFFNLQYGLRILDEDQN